MTSDPSKEHACVQLNNTLLGLQHFFRWNILNNDQTAEI